MRLTIFTVLFALILGVFAMAPATAQPRSAPTSTVQVHQLPSLNHPKPAASAPRFDTEKAVNAYLATVSGEARKRSDSYFEGGYVLLVVDTAYMLGMMALLLWLGVSGRMRDFAQSVTRSRFWQVPIYVALFVIITTILGFPLAVYEGFFREHAYGLSNMSFLQWLGDFAKSFGVQLAGTAILLTLIYAAIRATRRYWWVWGWLIATVFMVVVLVIAPVFLAPIFNKYYPLAEGPVKAEILAMARGNGIPATNVYEFDASKQSKRISANVSGFLGTTQISITDNLIKRATPREIYAVLGHEMGHYVLDHAIMDLTWLGALFLAGFAFVNWGFGWLTGMFGGSWGVRAIDDPAGLPVLVALITFFTFVATPVQNTIIRTTEAQADMFGVNTARQPDGFATVTLKLSEYRKLDPSPLEEFFMYDHPSGRSRITMAMRWKAEHLNDPDIKAGPVSPQ